ncbi:MAG: flavodoxin-dependent (E)-4-hydroxy-3-methylbut-2-enyl-diphosphate synthase [Candidatus Latescibacteria bacterium]|nr:flavodoxin-dependent (E)-4-hydroxy-3-methylbut-2-enyl-diphosphate synthase [Candidatus Latescibacterota bacterium]
MKILPVMVGSIQIGGGAPVRIQSMTKCRTENSKAVIKEIKQLEKVNCEIIRIAIPNHTAVKSIPKIKDKIKIPLVADIHFDYKLALESMKLGADKIRINPGNIGADYKVKEIIKAARDKKIPIRVGVNAGSISKTILAKYKNPNVQAILESIKQNLKIFEREDYHNIVLSAKTANPKETIEVYQKLAELYPYPLHIGVTEAGLPFEGAIRNTTALAILLNQGIGDTIRVSLTGPSILEVKAAQEILSSLGKRKFGPTLISCPTCGRCEVDLIKIASQVNKKLASITEPIKVAVMGCVVNGPGEAKTADYGIACGKKSGVIFKHGNIVKKCREQDLVSELFRLIKGS